LKLRTKSIYIVFLFILSVSNNGMSQDRSFTAGIFVGFNGIQIEGEINEMYSDFSGRIYGKGGLSIGLNVKHHISSGFYTAFEIRYMRKGSIFQFSSPPGTQTYESISLDYIELPLTFGYILDLKPRLIVAEAGLAYGRLFNYHIESGDFDYWYDQEKMEQLNPSDYSLVGALRYAPFKNQRFLTGFRFSYSLCSIHSVYKLYNMDYGVEISYLFN